MRPDVSVSDAEAGPTLPGKQRFLTLDHLDGRTIAAQRAHELLAAFALQFGGVATMSAAEHAKCRLVAMTVAVAEDMQARQLAGEPVDIDQVVRAANAAERAIKTLGKAAAKPPATGPTLAQYLAGLREQPT